MSPTTTSTWTSPAGQTDGPVEPLNTQRLDLARRRRGLTKTALAKKAGISTRMLTAYERGDSEPTADTFRNLAAAVRFPVTFLQGDDLEEVSADGVSFRALSAMSARERGQAIGAASIAMAIKEWTQDRFNLPAEDVPRVRSDVHSPEHAADAVRAAWGLGQKKISNMVHLLEAHGVRVFSLVHECASVDAFSFWHEDVPYIFLNGNKTAERSRMDAAHELGHLVMHFWGGPHSREAEEQAKAFGSAFLMPARSVIADMPAGASAKQIIQGRRRWNVAAMALAYRMSKLGMLSEWQARTNYIQLNRMGYRDGEPGGIDRETSQVWAKVFDTLNTEGTSRGDVARALSIPLEDLNALIFGLVTAPPRGAPTAITQATPDGPPQLRVV